MKKSNGYGSVYKESGKRRKPWRVVVTLGYDDDGKQIRKSLGYYATKKEAEVTIADYHSNKVKYLSELTIGDLYKVLIKRKESQVSESSMQGYRSAWKRLKAIEDMKIKDVAVDDMQNLIQPAIDTGAIGNGGAKQFKILCNLIFQLGIELKQVMVNYADFIVIPPKPKSDKRVFQDEDIKKLFVDNSFWSKVILLNIYLLARPNEILTTEIKNINLKENYLYLGSKTQAGINRFVPIRKEIRPIVYEFYNSSNDGYLINYMDKKLEYGTYLQNYTKTLKRLKIDYLSPHKCRKTGITIFSKSGLKDQYLTRIAGHADFDTTDKFYIGDINKEIQNAVNDLTLMWVLKSATQGQKQANKGLWVLP